MFNLASQLAEQVEAHLNLKRRNGWLTFKGPQAIELLRKVMLVQPMPFLIVHCHYNLSAGPQDYEFFAPESVQEVGRSKLVKITGRCRGTDCPETLFWHPERHADPSGTYLSSVTTLAKGFPLEALAAIELPELKY